MMHNARVMETEKMTSPAFGEAVVYHKQVDKPEAFTGRGEIGVFLGWNHNISHGANVLIEVDGEWDTVKTAKIRELRTKQVWRLVRDDNDSSKTVYVSQNGDVVWTPPMSELTTVEEYEFKGPYVEYQIKKLSPGWAWWYQSLSEVLPEMEAINLTKTEQETSIGEANLEDLKELDLGPGTSVERKRVFPEVPSTRERKTLAVSQITEEDTDDWVVLDSGEDLVQEDNASVQVEPSAFDQSGPEEGMDKSHEEESVHGWNFPGSEDLLKPEKDKWFIEVCCEENSSLSHEAKQRGWRIFRITQAKPLESVETQLLFAAASRHLREGGRVHAWFSLPCTAWSSWQRINKAKTEDHTAIKGKENESLFLQQLFRSYGFQILKDGGEISFEWPAYCDGWKCSIVTEFVELAETHTAICHGCMFGLTTK
eukprot:2530004-Amphidinium_carterae.1